MTRSSVGGYEHQMVPTHSLRWIIIAVFGLSSTLNYLDRQLLAATAPSLKAEFGLSNTEYGLLLTAFSVAYMLVGPFAGWFLDRVGLRLGAVVAVGAWSIFGMLTGFSRSWVSLLATRVGLGAAEAAGIPSSSKATSTYLKPEEYSLGNAVQSLDVTLGVIIAPIVVGTVAPLYGWRTVFLVCGVAGFAWIPLWLLASRISPPTALEVKHPVSLSAIALDRRLWVVIAASALIMVVHSLWINWTTIYLVEELRMTQTEANRYFAWIPPIFASLGGLLGGWWGARLIRKGTGPIQSRIRCCVIAAPLLVLTAGIPLVGTASLAVAGICVSFFAVMVILINLHVIPLHLFGAQRAAFTTSLLTSSYAFMQAILSPGIGFMVDHLGFQMVCVLVTVVALTGVLLVYDLGRKNRWQPI